MFKIEWYGINDGHYTPDSGTVKSAKCGACNARMNVKRNALGPTGFAEAMARRKHSYDEFSCPYLKENWHKRICRLKDDVRSEASEHHDDPIGLEKVKRAAKIEILKLLKKHAAR